MHPKIIDIKYNSIQLTDVLQEKENDEDDREISRNKDRARETSLKKLFDVKNLKKTFFSCISYQWQFDSTQ